jgi:hypothetical protein
MWVKGRLVGLAGALAMTTAVAACSSRGAPEGARDPSGRPIEAVSSVPPDPKALQQPGEAKAVLRLPRVESVGDCAPRYKTGQTGTCVNGQPCRGFGVRDEAGQVFCTCYGQVGGCAVDQRCDERKLVCVPEDEPPLDLTRVP